MTKYLSQVLPTVSHIYLVSKGGDDILKIVGGVAFYVERFYEKLKKNLVLAINQSILDRF